MITELDIAWLAGLLDGEGSFVLFKDKRANRGINTHVTVNMTDKDTVEEAGAILRYLSGDRVLVREKRPLSGFSRRLQHVVDVSSKNGCLRVLLAIEPYLRTKRLQALLIIDILRREVDVRKYRCTELDYAMMHMTKRLKHEDGGEARAEAVQLLGQVTPSQAILRLAPLASDRMEGVETRRVRRNDNPVHERPAPTATKAKGEDIVQAPNESSGSGLNSPTNESVH
jgi:hypothetical protein